MNVVKAQAPNARFVAGAVLKQVAMASKMKTVAKTSLIAIRHGSILRFAVERVNVNELRVNYVRNLVRRDLARLSEQRLGSATEEASALPTTEAVLALSNILDSTVESISTGHRLIKDLPHYAATRIDPETGDVYAMFLSRRTEPDGRSRKLIEVAVSRQLEVTVTVSNRATQMVTMNSVAVDSAAQHLYAAFCAASDD